jgi:hypothetical protein
MSINQWENSLADFLCFRDKQDIRTKLLSICKRSEVEKLEVHHLVKEIFISALRSSQSGSLAGPCKQE